MLRELLARFSPLSPSERVRWAAMVPLGLASAALEAAGGALVFALLSVVLDPAADSRMVASIRALLPASGPRAAVLTLAAWAGGVHIAKNVLVVGIAWWRARVAAFDTTALSTRLLRAYLAAPWAFHLQRGSAGLMENIRESTRPFFDVFASVSTIITEAAVIAALAAVAIAVAPLTVTAICAGIVLVLAIVLRVTREAQRRGGARQFELGSALYRHVQHGLGAMKEIRILGREPFFVEAFGRDARETARLEGTRATLDAVPRVLLETIFVVGMLALIVTHLGDNDTAAVLPLVSLYAYTGVRLIPAAHRIAVQINSLRWNLAASGTLVDDLRQLEGAAQEASRHSAPLPFRNALRAENISFSYEGSRAPVLLDVTLSVRRGETVAVVGSTGAGKTTLVDILTGLLTPSAGTVTVDGVPIAEHLASWQQNIGYVPQTPFLLDDTLRRNVALGVRDSDIDEQALTRAIGAAHLNHVVSSLPDGLDTVLGERGLRLSGGERQRIVIARALYRDPGLVILDEATASLDAATERHVADAIETLRGSRTLIVIAHRLTTVERCDRVLLLASGRIEAAGSYEELAASSVAFRSIAAID